MHELLADRRRAFAPSPGRLLSKGFWAVVDQGLFAVSNFLLSVTLARWLSPEHYGAFTVAFAIFLLLGAVHSALLTEPMMVFGPGRHKQRHREYLPLLLCGHWSLVAAASLLLLIIAAGIARFGSVPLAAAIGGLALAAPFILLLWFLRRLCAMRLEPQLAASAGFVYLVLMAAGLFGLYEHRWVSTPAALGVMGGASCIAGLWLAHRLHVSIALTRPVGPIREILRDHWGYGRWSVGSMTLTWMRADLYYLVLPLWQGLAGSAALKAVLNLILPVQHMNTALAVLLIPALVRARGGAEFPRLVRVAVALLTGASLAYWLLLVVFHEPVMTWLYAGRYDGYMNVVWMSGLILVTSSSVSIFGSALRAMERPREVFWAYGFATAVSLTVGLWLSLHWGVGGAAVGLALASAANAGVMLTYCKRLGGTDAADPAGPIVGPAHVL